MICNHWIVAFAVLHEDFCPHQIPMNKFPHSHYSYSPILPSLFTGLSLLLNMLDTGEIKASSSPWVALVILVKRKIALGDFVWTIRTSLTYKHVFPCQELRRIEK